MHCPKCGLQIESDELSFCSRCGQTLGLIRAVMAADHSPGGGSLEPRRSAVNLGVVLMFIGSIPPVLTLLLLNASASLPLAVLMFITAYLATVLGSGSLMKAFRTDETPFSDRLHREMRKEMAFGSTLMLIGMILAIGMVALVPGQWEKLAFIVFPLLAFTTTLLMSGWIKSSLWEILGAAPVRDAMPARPGTNESLETGELPTFQIAESVPPPASDFHPSSVTEGTTRLLKEDR